MCVATFAVRAMYTVYTKLPAIFQKNFFTPLGGIIYKKLKKKTTVP